MQQLPPPESDGRHIDAEILKPVLTTRDPAPRSLLELTRCQCRRSMCHASCSCSGTGLPCIESCLYMVGEACQTPHRTPLYFDSHSEDADDD